MNLAIRFTVRLLDQQEAAELAFVAQEGEVVFFAAGAFQFARKRVEHARLAEIVEGEIGIRHFLLELRTVRDDFNQALRQDQCAVRP